MGRIKQGTNQSSVFYNPFRRGGLSLYIAFSLFLMSCISTPTAPPLATSPERPRPAANSSVSNFEICAEEQQLQAVSMEIEDRMVRIRTAYETLSPPKPPWPWVRALAIHESGGRNEAISPTGCPGVLAICNQKGPPCCKPDPEDLLEYAYDLCNHEQKTGYLCDRQRDARFTDRAALMRLLQMFAEAGISEKKLQESQSEPKIVIPVFWNVGPKVVKDFPEHLKSETEVWSQLNFSRDPDFQRWRVHGLANKIVELHDYFRWFGFLTHVPSKTDQPWFCIRYTSKPEAQSKAFSDSESNGQPGGSRLRLLSLSEVVNLRKSYKEIRIMRLTFGQYQNNKALIKEFEQEGPYAP